MTRDQTPKFPLRNCINHESLLFGIWDGEPLPLGDGSTRRPTTGDRR